MSACPKLRRRYTIVTFTPLWKRAA